MKNKFSKKQIINDVNKQLSQICWLPKVYKTPLLKKLIFAATYPFVKTFSKAVTSIETIILNLYFCGEIKTFWSVQNCESVFKAINKLNNNKRASSFVTFDFSTLYANITHDKLQHTVKGIDTTVDNFDKHNNSSDKETFKLAIRYLLNHFLLET